MKVINLNQHLFDFINRVIKFQMKNYKKKKNYYLFRGNWFRNISCLYIIVNLRRIGHLFTY